MKITAKLLKYKSNQLSEINRQESIPVQALQNELISLPAANAIKSYACAKPQKFKNVNFTNTSEKIMEKICRSTHGKANVTYEQAVSVLNSLRYNLVNDRGSHRTFQHPTYETIVLVDPHGTHDNKYIDFNTIRKLQGIISEHQAKIRHGS